VAVAPTPSVTRACAAALLACAGLTLLYVIGAIPPARAQAAPGSPTAGTWLAIDTEASSIGIFVYRDGLLARFGHSHVIESRAVSGEVWLAEPADQSRFELRIPVATLIVDDPAARKAAGADFSSVPSAKDREGTRTNMLGSALLDAARSPVISVRSLSIQGAGPRYEVTAEVTIRGHAAVVQFPAEVIRTANGLRATGKFRVRQSDLGLKPFRALGGALKVRDEIRIGVEIVASYGHGTGQAR
jgi:polyisoprenoid-binding protein YceI